MPTVSFVPVSNLDAEGKAHGLDSMRFVENLLPIYNGWRSWPEQTFYSATIAAQVYGSYVHHFPAGMGGSTYTGDSATEFHGTELALYTFNPAVPSWTDISRGGGYSAGALIPAAWRFASFGNDIWAVNGVDVAQRRTNNAGNFANGVTSTFVPVPRFIGPVREYMISAGFNQVGRSADEFAWSDANDATWYDDRTGTRPASLAGLKAIRSRPGGITGFVGGEYGVFWKRRSMHGLQFTGGNDVFRLDEISRSVGTSYPGSIIAASDGFNYFFGNDGFYRQAGLSAPEKIPGPASLILDYDQFAKEPIVNNLPTEMWREDMRMVGGESMAAGLLFWFYRSKLNTVEGRCIRGLCLDTESLRWSALDCPSENYSTIVSRWTNMEEASFLWDVLGCTYDGAVTKRWKWFSTTGHAARAGTHRFALSFGESGSARPARIIGVYPVVATLESSTIGTGPHTAIGLPSGMTVNVAAANRMTFEQETDGATVISPRNELVNLTSVDQFNWFPAAVQGTWFVIDVNLPAAHTCVRSVTGFYILHEEIP